MRSGQQNKRSRGRNNGRKNANPLARSFESNGPDVKVRGNAAHIADRYVQLARDASASGDMIMAENYLQHAEHYFRIISAAQAQNQARFDQNNADRSNSDDSGDDDEDEGDSRFSTRGRGQNIDDNEGRDNRERRQSRGNNRNRDRQESSGDGDGNEAGTDAGDGSDGGELSDNPMMKPVQRPRRPRRRRESAASGDANLADTPQPETVSSAPAESEAPGEAAE